MSRLQDHGSHDAQGGLGPRQARPRSCIRGWAVETQDSNRYFDQIADDYDAVCARAGFDAHAAVTQRLLDRFAPPGRGAWALDIGGGTGLYAVELARRGYRVCCADPAAGMLREARERFRHERITERADVVQMAIEALALLPAERCALVLAEGGPLSYCTDAERAMAECLRILQPGAPFLTCVDARAGTRAALSAERGLPVSDQADSAALDDDYGARAVRLFSPAELEALARGAGLAVAWLGAKPPFPPGLEDLPDEVEDLDLPARPDVAARARFLGLAGTKKASGLAGRVDA